MGDLVVQVAAQVLTAALVALITIVIKRFLDGETVRSARPGHGISETAR